MRVFSRANSLVLERAFQKESYPSDAEIEALAQGMDVTERQIQNWYRRRRCRDKKQRNLSNLSQ